MSPRRTVIVLLFSVLSVQAQFGNIFEQMFQGQQQQQQRASGSSMWASQADSVECSRYLCPSTLFCANTPTDCPCPAPEDVKCIIPDAESKRDGTVICVRGEEGCAKLDRFIKP